MIDTLINRLNLIGVNIIGKNSFGIAYKTENKIFLILENIDGKRKRLEFELTTTIKMNSHFIVVYGLAWQASAIYIAGTKERSVFVNMVGEITSDYFSIEVTADRYLIPYSKSFDEYDTDVILCKAGDIVQALNKEGKIRRIPIHTYYPCGGVEYHINYMPLKELYRVSYTLNGKNMFVKDTSVILLDKDLNEVKDRYTI